MFRNVEPRWVEWMKLFLAIIPFPEISAARSMAMVARLAPGEDLRTGFTMQMVDEFRHSTIQMNLKKWYMETISTRRASTSPRRRSASATPPPSAASSVVHHRRRDHPANIYLTVVAETAFTTLFVAMPSKPRATVTTHCRRCSSRSSRTRAATSATATPMMMATLKDPDNHLLLERDLKYAFWQNHAIVDAAIGTFIEYGTTNRDKDKESYAEMWHRWIFEDYYRTYMLPLEYGIKIHHDDVQEA